MSETRPYRPANGTEGMIFQEKWCENCAFWQDDPDAADQCQIALNAFVCDVGDHEYPVEWVRDDSDDTYGNPRCTAFVERDGEKSEALKWATMQDEREAAGQWRLAL